MEGEIKNCRLVPQAASGTCTPTPDILWNTNRNALEGVVEGEECQPPVNSRAFMRNCANAVQMLRRRCWGQPRRPIRPMLPKSIHMRLVPVPESSSWASRSGSPCSNYSHVVRASRVQVPVQPNFTNTSIFPNYFSSTGV
jgi:hypothetical protein